MPDNSFSLVIAGTHADASKMATRWGWSRAHDGDWISVSGKRVTWCPDYDTLTRMVGTGQVINLYDARGGYTCPSRDMDIRACIDHAKKNGVGVVRLGDVA